LTLVKSIEVNIGVKGDAAAKAKIDKIDAEAEHLKKIFGDGFAVKIDAAAASAKISVFKRELADATKDRTATVKVKVDDSALLKFANKLKGAGGPAWLGPALLGLGAASTVGGAGAGAAIGLGGAAVAGGGALAAFGAVAKPVLADALKASQAVNTAQNNYNATIAAGVPKAQAQLRLQAANASAMLTYTAALKGGAKPATALAAYHLALAKNQLAYNSATNAGVFNAKAYAAEQLAIGKAYADLSPQQIALSKQLGAMADAWDTLKAKQTPVVAGALQPWLKSVTDLTKNLGPVIAAVAPRIRDLGFGFDALINSPQFRVFRDFITNTGSAAVNAAGGTLTDLIDAFIVLLPKFNPLIEKAVGWIGGLGPAVLRWSASKKASDDITRFMDWFNKNGPVVGGLLKNIGGALKALAPGLTAGSTAELQAMSGFFGFVAKLPPALAKPLAEVAGAMLILNKLGVVSVGVKLLGLGGTGAAGAAAGATAGIWSKLLPGVRLVSGALVAAVVVDMVLKNTPSGAPGSGKNWFDNPFGQGVATNPATGKQTGTPTPLTSNATFAKHWVDSWISLGHATEAAWNTMWLNTITRAARGFHDIAGWFDTGRHWVAATTHQTGVDIGNWWNITWNNTVGRVQRGFHDLAGWFDTGRHNISHIWDVIRSDAATAWNTIWNNTVTRTQNGIKSMMQWIGGVPAKVTGVFKGAISWLYNTGKDVIQGFWNGLTLIWTKVTSWISGIATWIKAHKGPVSLDQSLLYPAGQALMGGFLGGLKSGFGPVGSYVGGIASWIAGKIAPFKIINGKVAADAAAQAAAGAFGGGGGPVSADAAAAQRYAASRLGAYGWAANQIIPLMALWNQESGWNRFAYNASSGATGIPQALPYSKMPRAAWLPSQGGQASAGAQIDWGLGYIKGRYGSPAAAEAHEQANNWYARGTSSAAPGWAWVGEHGPELLKFRGGEQVAPVHAGSGRGGGTQTIIVKVDPVVAAADPELGRRIAGHLGKYIKSGGRLYPPGSAPR
jgi:hypothetical protein